MTRRGGVKSQEFWCKNPNQGKNGKGAPKAIKLVDASMSTDMQCHAHSDTRDIVLDARDINLDIRI